MSGSDGPVRLSERAERLIEERRQKYQGDPPLWHTPLAELPEDPKQRKALLEKSLREYPEEGRRFLSEMSELPALFEKIALATSDWPAIPEEDLNKGVFRTARETWAFYCNIMNEDAVKGWHLLEGHEQWYGEQIEAAEEDEEKYQAHRELSGRIYVAKVQYFVKRRVLRRFMRRYMSMLSVPGELSREEVKEIVAGTPGRPILEEEDPEGLCNALEAALDFCEDLDPDGKRAPKRVPGRELRKEVGGRIHLSPRQAREHMERAVKVLQESYGVPLPKPKTTVAYYYENRALLRSGLAQWRRDLAENRRS